MAQRTALFDRHVALGARMVEFGGYEMPLQYGGIRDEHLAVRGRAGVFDISHMGEVLITGPGAEASVQRLVANDVSRLAPGAALYGVMCTEEGGIVDDVIVYRELRDRGFMVVVNAGTRHKDVAWMRDHLGPDTELADLSDELALIAVQGPRALDIVAPLCEAEVASLRPFHSTGSRVAGIDSDTSVVSRTGYTGEDGVEIYIDATHAGELWDALLDAGRDLGLLPAGLGARDTLRLEAGLRLYGQDMDETVDPFSAGLGWTVKLAKGDFCGSDALRRIAEQGPPRRTVGLRLEGRSIARHGQPVLDAGRQVGEVSSGSYSFTLGSGIATALVEPDAAGRERLDVDIRGTVASAAVVPPAFYKR
ncbi:MAG TPA: glycine cleavage system aminomethyltransferase GcvT [Candidatus Dormibacteraeota bacterium]|jgi:aminomethyltransferase